MLMATKTETPVEKAEKLLPQIDSIFCGTLSGEEAREVIREGKSILRELKQLENGGASIKLLIESLKISIELAKGEIDDEK